MARLKVGDSAPDISLLNRAGEMVSISQSWREAPALISFLRHFG